MLPNMENPPTPEPSTHDPQVQELTFVNPVTPCHQFDGRGDATSLRCASSPLVAHVAHSPVHAAAKADNKSA